LQKLIGKFRLILVLTLVLGWIIVYIGSELITEGLWFNHLGFGNQFLKIISTKILIHLLLFVFTFLVYYVNFRFSLKGIGVQRIEEPLPYFLQLYRNLILKIPAKTIHLVFLIIGVIVAGYTTYLFESGWALWLQFMNKTAFNISDPVFGLDLSFFVFILPIIEMLQQIFLTLLIGLLPFTATIYVVFNPGQLLGWGKNKLSTGQTHLLTQLGLLLVLIATNFLIQALRLQLTSGPIIHGAGYTDIHARLPGYLLSSFTLIVYSIACFISFKKWQPIKMIKRGLLVLIIIFVSLIGLPSLVQNLLVEPNQFAKEKPYLENHINMTQRAYNLENIEVREFPSESKIYNLDNLGPTLDNIRLWDWRPLQLSYNQLQALSYYYDFYGIDVDRYVIDGKLRQVMLGAREIDLNRFEPHVQTWINTKLRYTHGYGIVMSSVDEVTSSGLPKFLLKDIPPVSSVDLGINRPEIYFGELTHSYVITNTNIKEFDYPKGDDNAETVYQGNGGIKLNSYLKKLLFAARFKDYRLLISNEITEESQILYNRQIVDRVQRIAPFLKLDTDPYLVLVEGRLFWLLDAYTTTFNYPYAAITEGWGNYARNSIKVVVDAYEGDVSFFLVDESDPLAQTWRKTFPRLFSQLSEAPDGLVEHFRYPVDLFRIQAEIYAKYHMLNPLVFYNDEDAWRIPEEKYESETISMDPYYSILQLNQEKDPEFILMLPFIPAKQISNMVAWMAALNDPPNYGQLVVYKFFKDRHYYGPMQIESRIDQDSEISQQLTLWDQRGSKVIRGNLLVIPLDGAILYVEPIFIQSEQSSIPELSRVIIAFEDKTVMAKTLKEALAKVFEPINNMGNMDLEDLKRQEATTEHDSNAGMESLILQAKETYDNAINAQKAGDWTDYGMQLKLLEDILKQLIYITDGAADLQPQLDEIGEG